MTAIRVLLDDHPDPATLPDSVTPPAPINAGALIAEAFRHGQSGHPMDGARLIEAAPMLRLEVGADVALAQLLCAADRPAAASQALRRGLIRDPGSALLHIECAKTLLSADDNAAMLRHASLAEQIAPDDVPIRCERSRLLRAAGRPDEACRVVIDAACRLGPHWELLRHVVFSLEALPAADRAGITRELLLSGAPCDSADPAAAAALAILHNLAVSREPIGWTAFADLLHPPDADRAWVLSLLTLCAEAGLLVPADAHAVVRDLSASAERLTAVVRRAQAAGEHSIACALLHALHDQGAASADAVFLLLDSDTTMTRAGRVAILDAGLGRFPQDSWLRIAQARMYENGDAPAPTTLPEAMPPAVAVAFAKAYQKRGRPALARKMVNLARVAAETDPGIAIECARILVDQEAGGEAGRLLSVALEGHPAHHDLLLEAAALDAHHGRLASALERARAALDAVPTSHRACLAMIHLLEEQGRIGPAIAQAGVFLASGHDPGVYAQWIRLQMRRIEQLGPREAAPLLASLSAALDTADDLPVPLLWPLFGLFDRCDHLEGLKRMAPVLARTLGAPEIGHPEVSMQGLRTVLQRHGLDVPDHDGGRGSIKLAELLVTAGLASLAGQARERALCCFLFAAALAPESQEAGMNAGLLCLSFGMVEEAAAALRAVRRITGTGAARIAWPCGPYGAWPQAPLPLGAAFERGKPQEDGWPQISVVVPSFNQGHFLEETLLSLLHQDYPNLQIIVVDGNSTDGSHTVIERFRARLDHVVIEPDKGQTDAINKGLAVADGALVTWLNSDDMLAPGALYMLALAWLDSGADILFGLCLAHRGRRIEVVNMPAVTQETFTTEHLARIFDYWLKGHYFYQPEAVFSRRILDALGGRLDDTLHYTMDYAFWLRCAEAGARVEPVHWPVALFRHHPDQKTARLDDCIIEQGLVRNRFCTPRPSGERIRAVRGRLRKALQQPRVQVGVTSGRLDKVFSSESADALRATFADSRFAVNLAREPAALEAVPDILIHLVHLQNDAERIAGLRERGFSGPVIGWFWDNHHHLFDNVRAAESVDLLLPSHAFAADYLAGPMAVCGPHLPLCVSQWTGAEADRLARDDLGLPRWDRLHGGFVRYEFAERRNRLAEELIQAGYDGIRLFEETDPELYFRRSSAERFRDWSRHKAGLVLPLQRDLSQRLFDSLLAGQVPIVAGDVADLDLVIPASLREVLPLVVLDTYTVDAVSAAHRRAVALFDRDGQAGVLRRHMFARHGHMLEHRIATILQDLPRYAGLG